MSEPLPLRVVGGAEPSPIELRLSVTDREMVADLEAFPDVRERATFAMNALRIGLLALRQARGRIDADAVKAEGERILTSLGSALKQHESLLTAQVKATLAAYFDPGTGHFTERVQQLVKKDGDLEGALKRQIGGEGSELAKTLSQSVGKDSPLYRLLSPTQNDGVVSLLGKAVEKELSAQREKILGEFSLDQANSALSRLVAEVKKKSGELGTDLKSQIDVAVGALSLDKDGSALNRLQKQLMDVIEGQNKANASFQEHVRVTLEKMVVRKEEAARSTRHGGVFEDEVCAFVERRALAAGDTPVRTGNTTGAISNTKVGDCVVTLRPDHRAAGAKIVIEAKQKASTTLSSAIDEIAIGRRNRAANVGIFVMSRRLAPAGFPTFTRRGDDLFVTWDAEDQASDIHLEAALSTAEALCTRAALHSEARTTDLEALDKSVNEIEKQVSTLEEIETSATTISRGSATILKRVEILRGQLSRQVGLLRDGLKDLRAE